MQCQCEPKKIRGILSEKRNTLGNTFCSIHEHTSETKKLLLPENIQSTQNNY